VITICGLFIDAISSSDCVASNDRMLNECWFGEDTEGSGHDLIDVTLPHLRRGTQEKNGKTSYDSRSAGRATNLRLP
jgi:hypothetical protein